MEQKQKTNYELKEGYVTFASAVSKIIITKNSKFKVNDLKDFRHAVIIQEGK